MSKLTQVVCAAGLALLIGAAGCGDDDDDADAALKSGDCSNASLDGSYGVRFEGTNRKLGRFASVSLWTFDGAGRMDASEDFVSERSGPRSRKVGGGYRVKSDCTFELRFGSDLVRRHEAHGKCVLVTGGREFYCLDNEEGWVTTGTGKKL